MKDTIILNNLLKDEEKYFQIAKNENNPVKYKIYAGIVDAITEAIEEMTLIYPNLIEGVKGNV